MKWGESKGRWVRNDVGGVERRWGAETRRAIFVFLGEEREREKDSNGRGKAGWTVGEMKRRK